jgi:hypothetical protein
LQIYCTSSYSRRPAVMRYKARNTINPNTRMTMPAILFHSNFNNLH